MNYFCSSIEVGKRCGGLVLIGREVMRGEVGQGIDQICQGLS